MVRFHVWLKYNLKKCQEPLAQRTLKLNLREDKPEMYSRGITKESLRLRWSYMTSLSVYLCNTFFHNNMLLIRFHLSCVGIAPTETSNAAPLEINKDNLCSHEPVPLIWIENIICESCYTSVPSPDHILSNNSIFTSCY